MNLRLYIDYDNLNEHQKRKGLLDLITRSLLSTPVPTTKISGRCEVRVYGGWYEATTLTPLAQKVIAELGRDFPTVLPVCTKEGLTGKLNVSAELACSLEAEPSQHLFNTFRVKSAPRALKCDHPSTKGCAESDCPLTILPVLFDTEKCPRNGCSIGLHDIVFRREQKLIDTMLTCDLIHSARTGNDFMMFVSSDDDLLPAIRVALISGTPFARLHPKRYYQLAAFPPGGAHFIEKEV